MKIKVLLTLPLLLLLASSCSRQQEIVLNIADDSFYDQTRHIMTREEIEIYRNLPDSESRKKFAKEFWEKRDPDPSTEENEALEEFQRRIDFANRWFNERIGKDRGWDSLRGRILLQLGFPDERRTGNAAFIGTQLERRYSAYEIWVYMEYQLQLVFVDKRGFGRFEFYGRIPAALSEAVERSKLSMLGSGPKVRGNRFRFRAQCEGDALVISIPTKHVGFKEEDDNLGAHFSFTIYIYREHKLMDTIKRELHSNESRDEVLKKNELTFTLPLPLTQNGRYFLDIIGQDEQSGERSRAFCKIRIKKGVNR